MMKAVYTYTVIDKQIGKTILDHVSNDEVSKRIGIDRRHIADYVKNNRLFQGRYRIYKHVEMIEEVNKEPEEKYRAPWAKKIMREWEQMRKAADLLRNGGRIVGKYVKGKYVKHVEAKR
jgi:hypothetical protein